MPEIHAGTVEIKAIAREAGSRSKVAVASRQEGLDPVGATVGQRGARVQAVVAELAGEKIDVIPWNEDPSVFVANALSPAQVLGVEHRRGAPDRDRHRARADAVARDRPRGPERAPRRPADRLADRHPERRRRRRGRADRGVARERRRQRGRRSTTWPSTRHRVAPAEAPAAEAPAAEAAVAAAAAAERAGAEPPSPRREAVEAVAAAARAAHRPTAEAAAAPAKPKRARKVKAAADEEVAS